MSPNTIREQTFCCGGGAGMLEKAFYGGKKYWALLAFLGLLITAGVITFLVQLNRGLTITGLSRDVPWGFYIAQLTFLVGVAASAVMVVLPYYLHNFKAFGRVVILGEFLATPACFMCMLFVVVDMGQGWGRVWSLDTWVG